MDLSGKSLEELQEVYKEAAARIKRYQLADTKRELAKRELDAAHAGLEAAVARVARCAKHDSDCVDELIAARGKIKC